MRGPSALLGPRSQARSHTGELPVRHPCIEGSPDLDGCFHGPILDCRLDKLPVLLTIKEQDLPVFRLELANMTNSAFKAEAGRARIVLLVQFGARPAAIEAFHP